MKLILIYVVAVIFGIAALDQNGGKMTTSELTTFSLSKVGQISVRAKDLDRATAFYRDKLGLRPVIAAPSISVLDCGGIYLLLGRPENAEQDHPGSIIYFDVTDIQQAFTALSERGVVFVQKPGMVGELDQVKVWIAIFRDSEDNLMGLRCMVPAK